MSKEVLRDIIDKAVADYGFRLAVMHGVDDVIAASDLSDAEAPALRDTVVPELKNLPDPVEPADRLSVQSKLADLASGA